MGGAVRAHTSFSMPKAGPDTHDVDVRQSLMCCGIESHDSR